MKILGIIPARGGSKGLPRKNIRLLGGKPLIQHTIEAARQSRCLTHTILSTDDPEIADVGAKCGVDVPFLRPPELARDASPTLPVILHAIRFFAARGEHYEAICLLQPTSPLRPDNLIDRCCQRFIEEAVESAMTVLPIPAHHHPSWAYKRDDHGRLKLYNGDLQPLAQRQLLPPAFFREGSVYLAKTTLITEKHTLYGSDTIGIEVDPGQSVNIDTADDWARAEALFASRVTRS